jgi:hypothetical protein
VAAAGDKVRGVTHTSCVTPASDAAAAAPTQPFAPIACALLLCTLSHPLCPLLLLLLRLPPYTPNILCALPLLLTHELAVKVPHAQHPA